MVCEMFHMLRHSPPHKHTPDLPFFPGELWNESHSSSIISQRTVERYEAFTSEPKLLFSLHKVLRFLLPEGMSCSLLLFGVLYVWEDFIVSQFATADCVFTSQPKLSVCVNADEWACPDCAQSPYPNRTTPCFPIQALHSSDPAPSSRTARPGFWRSPDLTYWGSAPVAEFLAEQFAVTLKANWKEGRKQTAVGTVCNLNRN